MSGKKTPSIRRNYTYNLIYQIMTLLTPFLTTPYISRVLGPEGTGVQSYTNSVVQYFAVLAALGTASYGQREIARHRDQKGKMSRLFWEIQALCMLTTLTALAAWVVVILRSDQYRVFYGVLTMTLIAVAFDISWFFGGLEQYGRITLRNIAIKLTGIVGLFLFVKERDDLLLYVTMLAGTGLLGNISVWGYLKGLVEAPEWKELRPFRHLKETMVYFIPTIATSVYTILDKTMLGWYTGNDKTQNGYYEYATGFVNMAKILILSFNAVMSARMSYLFGLGKKEEIGRRIGESLDFVLLLAMPLMLGLAAVAERFSPWFLGDGYRPVVQLLYVCAPLVLIVGLSDCMGSQILTPGGKRAESGRVIVAGAVLNGVLNLLLIQRFHAAGAAAASLVAECLITGLYLWLSREYVSLGMLFRCGWKRLAGAVVMAIGVRFAGDALAFLPGPFVTVIQVGTGAVIYGLALLVLRDSLILHRLRILVGKPLS